MLGDKKLVGIASLKLVPGGFRPSPLPIRLVWSWRSRLPLRGIGAFSLCNTGRQSNAPRRQVARIAMIEHRIGTRVKAWLRSLPPSSDLPSCFMYHEARRGRTGEIYEGS
jgi:hypothetical protein